MKVANEIYSNKCCFSLNKPTNTQVEVFEQNIRRFRRWVYVIFFVDDNLKNDQLVGIIDFEN
jgi:hypothetical protein